MRNINILIFVNRFVLVMTVILYITFVYGLYAQLLLGVFQLITGLGLLLFWKQLTKDNRKRLGYYWLAVVVYFGLGFFGAFEVFNASWISLIVIPLGIAGYFTYFLELMRTKRRNVFSLN